MNGLNKRRKYGYDDALAFARATLLVTSKNNWQEVPGHFLDLQRKPFQTET
jgi:hypothetical protein